MLFIKFKLILYIKLYITNLKTSLFTKMVNLTYEIYNKKQFAVRGDRNRYNDIIKGIGGRWNSRMRGGEGWLLSLDKKEELDTLINELKKDNENLNKSDNEDDQENEGDSEDEGEDEENEGDSEDEDLEQTKSNDSSDSDEFNAELIDSNVLAMLKNQVLNNKQSEREQEEAVRQREQEETVRQREQEEAKKSLFWLFSYRETELVEGFFLHLEGYYINYIQIQ